MKPSDHPDFFRLPAPEGRSRESTIVLDRFGTWHHDAERVEHAGLAAAFPTWLRRHPDDGRFILSNGYDWCYVTVEATPFFVVALDVTEGLRARLSDGSEELLDPASLRLDEEGVVVCRVKEGAYEARFMRQAQLALAPLLSDSDAPAVVVGGRSYLLG